MYIEEFESFQQQAEELYKSRPLETRYTIKYRHTDGKLVLKVTDDVVCLKYKTDQHTDLKKLERLNTFFMGIMAGADMNAAVEQIPGNVEPQPAATPGSKKNRRKG